MSLAEATASLPAAQSGRVGARAANRFLRNELRLVFRRRRNIVLLAVLGLAPLLIGIAIKVSPPTHSGDGPQFLDKVTGNGLFLVFTALVVTLPVFLPLATAIVAGDTIAGEASQGTLRSILTVPVSRTRLLLTKWLAAVIFVFAAVVVVGVVALSTGAAFFPLGRVTLLSGDTVTLTDGLLRAALVAGYVAISLVGLATIGLLFSTLTEVPVAAMAMTLGFVIVSAVMDGVPQLHVLHPYLLSHHWLDFGELLRSHPQYTPLVDGLWLQLGYTAIAGSLAWARFVNADVTS
jgi:ABC-2 type transport system permease protein